MVEFAAKGEFYKYMNNLPYRRFPEKQAARVCSISLLLDLRLLFLTFAAPISVHCTNERRFTVPALEERHPPRHQAREPASRPLRRAQD